MCSLIGLRTRSDREHGRQVISVKVPGYVVSLKDNSRGITVRDKAIESRQEATSKDNSGRIITLQRDRLYVICVKVDTVNLKVSYHLFEAG